MSVTGFVDGYYAYNFEHPHTVPCPTGTVPIGGFNTSCSAFRAFDGPSQQLGLNMVELILDKPPDATNSRIGYHVAFGFGTHFCLGSSLARLELVCMIEHVLKRLPDIERVDDAEPAHRPANFISGYEEMPVRFTPTDPVLS